MTPERLAQIRAFIENPEAHGGIDTLKAEGLTMMAELLEHADMLDKYTFDKVAKRCIEEHRKRMADPNRRRSYSEIIRDALPLQELPQGALPIYDRDLDVASAIFCEHANEVPNVCPCPADCYCKTHTCARR